MLVVSLEQAVTVVEKMIDAARDQDVRDQLVVRLARLDQYLAALRDHKTGFNVLYGGNDESD